MFSKARHEFTHWIQSSDRPSKTPVATSRGFEHPRRIKKIAHRLGLRGLRPTCGRVSHRRSPHDPSVLLSLHGGRANSSEKGAHPCAFRAKVDSASTRCQRPKPSGSADSFGFLMFRELSVGLRRSVGLGGELEAVTLGHPIMPVGDGLGS